MRKTIHRVVSILALTLLPILASAFSVEQDTQAAYTAESFSGDVITHNAVVGGQSELSRSVPSDVSYDVSLFREQRLSDFVDTSFSAVPVMAFLYLFGFGLISLAGLSGRGTQNAVSSERDVS